MGIAKNIMLGVLGVGTFGSSVLVSYQMARPVKQYGEGEVPRTVEATKAVYDRIASGYDNKTDWDEWVIGIRSLRQKLAKEAHGTVLEVAAGTGRNVQFYLQSKVTDLYAVDSSDMMLAELKKKGQEHRRQVHTGVMSCEKLGFPDNSFDTVVDTFGLCSVADPEQALAEMVRVCKPDGKVLLLEHGRSQTWTRLTSYLDTRATEHASNWGCWWNRNIPEIVAKGGAGLDIVEHETKHFGTTYYYVAKKKPSA